jgi:hypothetical protein
MTAFDQLLTALETGGNTVTGNGRQRMARCPSHDDGHASLSVTQGNDRVLIKCQAGCDTDDILGKLDLTRADLFDTPLQNGNGRQIVATYDYLDEAGTMLFQVVRFEPKDFRQRRPDGASGWDWTLGNTRRVLYRLPQVLAAAKAHQSVYVVEGERDVHSIEITGAIATCNPGGAGKWRPHHTAALAGAKVVVVADRDTPGRAHARQVIASLRTAGISARLLEPATGKDTTDHLAAGLALTDLAPVADEVDELAPVGDLDAVRARFHRLDIAALLSADRPPREWVIPGLIPAGAAVALIAPAGTGKSLLLLAAMIGVARGDRAFAGLPIPRARRVVLVDMENTEDDLADRLLALGITAADVVDLENLVIIHLPPLTPLDTEAGGLEFGALIDAYAIQAGDVVVLDSLQRVVKGPENDSDTLRAFYRCTGMALKKRGLAVVRTDNTGKETDKGARGTSGKRDDVDIELILTRDPDHPDRLRIKPGKSRLPDIISVLINRDVDDDGHLSFTTAGDPFRALVGDAHQVLELLNIPVETGERKAAEIIKAHGQAVVRAALRVAIKERKNPLWTVSEMSEMPTPSTHGAPSGAEVETDRAELSRRTYGAPPENGDSEHKTRAEHPRRTLRATDAGAPADTAPPLPLSKERRAGARDHLRVKPDLPCPACGEPKDMPAPVNCSAAVAHGRKVS